VDKRAKRERSVEKILSAAVEVFSEYGYSAPLDEVAKRAGVSKALIFWYFKSKENLVLEVAKKSLPGDVLDECMRSGLSREQLVRCIGVKYLEKYRDRAIRRLFLHTISASAVYPEIGVEMKSLCTSRLRELAKQIFGHMTQEGEVRLRAFMGALMCYVIHEPEIDEERFIDSLVKLVVG